MITVEFNKQSNKWDVYDDSTVLASYSGHEGAHCRAHFERTKKEDRGRAYDVIVCFLIAMLAASPAARADKLRVEITATVLNASSMSDDGTISGYQPVQCDNGICSF